MVVAVSHHFRLKLRRPPRMYPIGDPHETDTFCWALRVISERSSQSRQRVVSAFAAIACDPGFQLVHVHGRSTSVRTIGAPEKSSSESGCAHNEIMRGSASFNVPTFLLAVAAVAAAAVAATRPNKHVRASHNRLGVRRVDHED